MRSKTPRDKEPKGTQSVGGRLAILWLVLYKCENEGRSQTSWATAATIANAVDHTAVQNQKPYEQGKKMEKHASR